MNCKQYRTGIEDSDFAAGREAARGASHADGCAECRAYGDETAKLRGLVAGLARVDAPPDFEFRLRARMSAADPAPARPWTQNLLPRAAWLAAAGCLALAAALALQTRNQQPTDGRATSAPPAAGQAAANTAPTANAGVASRAVSGDESGEATASELRTSSELTASSRESGETFAARRKARAATIATASVASANGARQTQRRLAGAASAEQLGGETVESGGAQVGRTETNTMSMTGSSVIVTSSIPLPASAGERPLQVLFKDTQGASRVVNVDPVAFGSGEPAARPTNVTYTKAKKQGVW